VLEQLQMFAFIVQELTVEALAALVFPAWMVSRTEMKQVSCCTPQCVSVTQDHHNAFAPFSGVDCGGSCPLSCATCSDGIKNGNEQGVDCGGSCPTVCPTCFDNLKNGNETGIDCGGSCPACPTCFDGIKNGNEAGGLNSLA
jgi:hypothetical protein